MAHKEVFCYFSGDCLRDDVVERRHPKAGHHGPATLFRQQLMPDHFLGFERVLRLKCFKTPITTNIQILNAFLTMNVEQTRSAS